MPMSVISSPLNWILITSSTGPNSSTARATTTHHYRCDKINNVVKIVQTEKQSQVSQRIEGFRNASHSLVLQCDDDLLPDKRCLENLAAQLIEGEFAVGPRFRSSDGTIKSGLLPCLSKKTILEKILFYLANGSKGFQPGSVSKIGIGFGITETTQKVVQVEWLPGGMVMHHKRNLILNNYYSYQGKAFSEDIIHSQKLLQNGVKLLMIPEAVCFIPHEKRTFSKSLQSNIQYLIQYFKICNDFKISKVRFILFWNILMLKKYLYG